MVTPLTERVPPLLKHPGLRFVPHVVQARRWSVRPDPQWLISGGVRAFNDSRDQKVAALVSGDDFIAELSDALGVPGETEQKAEFVARGKAEARRILRERLKG